MKKLLCLLFLPVLFLSGCGGYRMPITVGHNVKELSHLICVLSKPKAKFFKDETKREFHVKITEVDGFSLKTDRMYKDTGRIDVKVLPGRRNVKLISFMESGNDAGGIGFGLAGPMLTAAFDAVDDAYHTNKSKAEMLVDPLKEHEIMVEPGKQYVFMFNFPDDSVYPDKLLFGEASGGFGGYFKIGKVLKEFDVDNSHFDKKS